MGDKCLVIRGEVVNEGDRKLVPAESGANATLDRLQKVEDVLVSRSDQSSEVEKARFVLDVI